MSKHRLKGREIMLFMGASHATTQAIGGSVSAEIEITASLIEVSDPNSSQWLDFIVGRKSWKMTLGKLLILPDFYDGEKVGQKVTVQFGYSVNSREGIAPEDRFTAHYYEGTAIITRWVCSGKNGDYSTGSFGFQGCSALNPIDLPNFILDESELDDRDVELE